MTREKQIEQAWLGYAIQSYRRYDEKSFKEGVKWADENPNKRKVYTKDELFKMGFAFDTNGNIADPRRDAEMWDRYVEYKQNKWLDKVCKYIAPILQTYCSDECVKELIEGLRNKMVGDL